VQTDLVGEQTIGVRLSDGHKTVYYIPGCAEVPDSLLDLLTDADGLFFDGTLWEDDEMITSGTGIKTGRRMEHISIDGPEGSMTRLASVAATKTYIHINNTNPIWQPDGPERKAVFDGGWGIAYDGLKIEI